MIGPLFYAWITVQQNYQQQCYQQLDVRHHLLGAHRLQLDAQLAQ